MGQPRVGSSPTVGISQESLFISNGVDTCKEIWSSWPEIQERSLANGNVFVLKLFASVGNLFLTLNHLISVSHGHPREVFGTVGASGVYTAKIHLVTL